jgi:hypothetical protein
MKERTHAQRGKRNRQRGAEFERELVNLFRDHGLKAERVPLSGATSYAKDDVEVTPTFAEKPWRGECKRKSAVPKWIVDALGECNFMAMRGDRQEALIVIRASTFAELLQ